MTTNDQGNFAVPGAACHPGNECDHAEHGAGQQCARADALDLYTPSPLVLTEIASGTVEDRTMGLVQRRAPGNAAAHYWNHVHGDDHAGAEQHGDAADPITVDGSNVPLVFPTTGSSGTGFIRVTLPAKLAGTVVVSATITDDGTGGTANAHDSQFLYDHRRIR